MGTKQNLAKQSALDLKQDKLIPGTNITIASDGKTISAAGGGSTVSIVPSLLSGVQIAAVTIDGNPITLYAPQGSTNYYGTTPPSAGTGDNGSIYLQYDSSTGAITALYGKVQNAWAQIQTGGGSLDLPDNWSWNENALKAYGLVEINELGWGCANQENYYEETVEWTVGGRHYQKENDTPAFVFAFQYTDDTYYQYRHAYAVSTDQQATYYYVTGYSPNEQGESFTYQGQTWYYSGGEYSMNGAVEGIEFIGNFATLSAAIEYVLDNAKIGEHTDTFVALTEPTSGLLIAGGGEETDYSDATFKVETNGKVHGTDFVEGTKSWSQWKMDYQEILQADYNLLTPEQKQDITFFITDADTETIISTVFEEDITLNAWAQPYTVETFLPSNYERLFIHATYNNMEYSANVNVEDLVVGDATGSNCIPLIYVSNPEGLYANLTSDGFIRFFESTNYTLTLNKIEGIRSGEDAPIVPNPPESATQTLEKVEIDGIVYDFEAGSNIIPNPTGTPTDTLEKISIDDVIYDFAGGGGGGGSSYIEDTLFSSTSGVDSTSQGVSISLSGNISDYDVIVFEAGRSDGNAYRKGQVWYLTSSLVIGTNHLQVIENNLNANIYWIHDSDTSITWASAYSAYPTTLFSIKGLKFGSGSGGGYTATELVSSTITVAQDPGTPFTLPKPYTDYDLISITTLPDTAYGNSLGTQFTVSTAGLEIGKSYIFNIDPGRNVAIYFTVTSSTQFTFLRGWQAYAYYITSIIGMEFGGEHAGVPGIATLLWENSSPSSGMAADTVITISTLQKYDLIGIVPIHNVSDNLATNAMQLFSTENTSVNNQLITANSGNANNYARTFTITNGTTLTFSNGMQPGVAYNSNYVVPLRIYGFRFGNGDGGGSSGSGYSETTLYTASSTSFIDIPLTWDWTDYDAYLFFCNDVNNQTGNPWFITKGIITSLIGSQTTLTFYPYSSSAVHYVVTANQLTASSQTQGFYIRQIVGLNFGGGGSSSSEHTYSTTEHKVGKWIDGSDIYEKTINLGSFSVGSWSDHTIESSTSINLLIDYDGYMVESNTMYALPDPSVRIKIDSNQNLIFTGTASWSISSGYITIRYTKTTS